MVECVAHKNVNHVGFVFGGHVPQNLETRFRDTAVGCDESPPLHKFRPRIDICKLSGRWKRGCIRTDIMLAGITSWMAKQVGKHCFNKCSRSSRNRIFEVYNARIRHIPQILLTLRDPQCR